MTGGAKFITYHSLYLLYSGMCSIKGTVSQPDPSPTIFSLWFQAGRIIQHFIMDNRCMYNIAATQNEFVA
jgi:hypothetical protein